MKKNPWNLWNLWIDTLLRIIGSDTPRKVNNDLRRCINLWPHTDASLENVEALLTAIVKLRNSK